MVLRNDTDLNPDDKEVKGETEYIYINTLTTKSKSIAITCLLVNNIYNTSIKIWLLTSDYVKENL